MEGPKGCCEHSIYHIHQDRSAQSQYERSGDCLNQEQYAHHCGYAVNWALPRLRTPGLDQDDNDQEAHQSSEEAARQLKPAARIV